MLNHLHITKSLLPYKVILAGSRDQDMAVFGGRCSAPTGPETAGDIAGKAGAGDGGRMGICEQELSLPGHLHNKTQRPDSPVAQNPKNI